MSELAQERDPLADIELHGRPVRTWINWLSRDSGRVPASRYGSDSEDCAYWAVACECIYVDANGDDNEPAEGLNYYQGLVVNDSDEVIDLVLDYWGSIPEALKPYLDYEDNGLNLAQQSRLKYLCGRYNVPYDAEHYFVHKENSWMTPGWAEGWIGNDLSTIYVGVSPEGDAHS